MAIAWITEYKSPVTHYGSSVPVGLEPALAVQQVTFTTSTASAALSADTNFVRILCDGNAHMKVGQAPVATTGDTPLRADVAEYFGVSPEYTIAFVTGV